MIATNFLKKIDRFQKVFLEKTFEMFFEKTVIIKITTKIIKRGMENIPKATCKPKHGDNTAKPMIRYHSWIEYTEYVRG